MRNVAFRDVQRLLRALGFELVRIRGSHHAFHHSGIRETLVLQPTKPGDARPYQLRQLMRLVEQYALRLEDA